MARTGESPAPTATARRGHRLSFRLLGFVEVELDGRVLDLGGGTKLRALLAVLLLHANEPVSRTLLTDALWNGDPPATADHALSEHVSQVRKTLRGARPECSLRTRPGGYVLAVDPERIDVHRFERLAADGRQALAVGDPERAAELLRGALAEWRGEALADVVLEPFAALEAARLEELRLEALEARIDADLLLGRDAVLIPELDLLVARHPVREHLVGRLMLALYRSDRQAEALAVYRDARARFVGELGIEPSTTLQFLHEEILRHAPELDAPHAPAAGA